MENNFEDHWLSAYLDDELSSEERLLVEQQLASDPAARELLEDLKRLRGLVSDLPRWSGPDLKPGPALLQLMNAEETDIAALLESDSSALAELIEEQPALKPTTVPSPRRDASAGEARRWTWLVALAAGLIGLLLTGPYLYRQFIRSEMAMVESQSGPTATSPEAPPDQSRIEKSDSKQDVDQLAARSERASGAEPNVRPTDSVGELGAGFGSAGVGSAGLGSAGLESAGLGGAVPSESFGAKSTGNLELPGRSRASARSENMFTEPSPKPSPKAEAAEALVPMASPNSNPSAHSMDVAPVSNQPSFLCAYSEGWSREEIDSALVEIRKRIGPMNADQIAGTPPAQRQTVALATLPTALDVEEWFSRIPQRDQLTQLGSLKLIDNSQAQSRGARQTDSSASTDTDFAEVERLARVQSKPSIALLVTVSEAQQILTALIPSPDSKDHDAISKELLPGAWVFHANRLGVATPPETLNFKELGDKKLILILNQPSKLIPISSPKP